MAKYTITIADIDLNISTEESPEMVDRLVGMLDRRIRDLLARMPRLSKSEATILCAVDYCAQYIKTEDKTHEIEHDFVKLSKENDMLREENARLQANTEDLRRENRVMHNIITKSVNSAFPAFSKPVEGEQLTIKTEEKVEETAVAEPTVVEAAVAEPTVQNEPAPVKEPAPAKTEAEKPAPAAKVMFEDEKPADKPVENKPARQKAESDIDDIPTRKVRRRAGAGQNKVGDMFDMLTFKDV
jgi:cell division protein ZapA (FtsZ GTPase activity inhibitor)